MVYNQEKLLLQTIYVLNKEILQKNPRFIIKSGFKSREGYIGARTICVSRRIRLQIAVQKEGKIFDIEVYIYICKKKGEPTGVSMHTIGLCYNAVTILHLYVHM